MLKILALDPSGTGTTGIALMENGRVIFKEFANPNWQAHWQTLIGLMEKFQPKIVLYESTNYIHSRGKDMTSLFKLLGGLESLGHSESVPVNQVKGLKQKLFTGKATIAGITYSSGRGKG